RSNYAMCAVSPSRVGKTFDRAALREIEIVNFNVKSTICLGGRAYYITSTYECP
ncbi:hypothetical protein BC827DRAFT_1176179, partial [Russula dissimulans]